MVMRLSKSVVGKEEAQAVERVLCGHSYLGMGEEVDLFEQELADFLGVPREWVVCVNTGTSALHLSIEALTNPGDRVLVQSLTYLASFQAISAASAIPMPCEIDPNTVTIDLKDADRRFTDEVKVIMPVHYASNPGDLDAIYDYAKKKKIRVVEDAAHAFGCRYKGRHIGSFGDIVCFSYDGIKNITCGEGGAIVTADKDVLARVKDTRLLGVEKDTDKRYAGERSWEFDVRHRGYRYHMSNIMAAVGRVQLRKFADEFAPKRVALARRYRERLKGLDEIRLLDAELGDIIPHLQPVRILEGRRDAVRRELGKEGIQTGIHYKPNHLLTLYGAGKSSLPTTEAIYGELLSLPLHPELETADVDHVCNVITAVLQGGFV
jgi:dTDP-4-amino-4,6-dideoxygalactose transaminase